MEGTVLGTQSNQYRNTHYMKRAEIDYHFGSGVIATIQYVGHDAQDVVTEERTTVHNAGIRTTF